MAFSESLKVTVRKRSHHSCCVCHEIGVEIHHIVPQEQDGSDDEDNAAPLCPTCHDRYGANPEKRKFIREVRDAWYEICERRFAPDADRLSAVEVALRNVATKADLDRVVIEVSGLLRDAANNSQRTIPERAQDITHINSLVAPGIGMNRACMKCGTFVGLMIGDQGRCPNCGSAW